jgi:pyruvate ferredoxin oxidoreductase gamma subunit
VIRIRFHGRGGHGMKTASRIVGTAAFLAGYHVQDSPVYGAERRGAAVTAFTRISVQPILERGAIVYPDLIILADETLLEDNAAGVLSGQETASGIFINSCDISPLIAKYGIESHVASYDLTGRTREVLGRASALSAGLAAAAAALTGYISQAQLVAALTEEFEHLHLGEEVIEKNRQVAVEVFSATPAVEISRPEAVPTEAVTNLGYHSPLQGSPSIVEPGTAIGRHTGTWRVQRPVIDRDVCTRCGMCVVRCPDGAIALDEEGYPVIDYDHCKGCMICRHECPVLGITEEMETRAW